MTTIGLLSKNLAATKSKSIVTHPPGGKQLSAPDMAQRRDEMTAIDGSHADSICTMSNIGLDEAVDYAEKHNMAVFVPGARATMRCFPNPHYLCFPNRDVSEVTAKRGSDGVMYLSTLSREHHAKLSR